MENKEDNTLTSDINHKPIVDKDVESKQSEEIQIFEVKKLGSAGLVKSLATPRINQNEINELSVRLRNDDRLMQYQEDQFLTDGVAWDTVWSHSIPYVIDPTAILWMSEEYSALWHIPRAPVTYRILKEFHKGGRGGEARLIPSLGDDIITNFNVDAFYSPAAPYVLMLLDILAQSTRLEMPLPTFWMTCQDTMTIRSGTGVIRDLDDAWWERISAIGIDRRPAIGIESVDHIYDHSMQPSILDNELPFGGWAQDNELGREANEDSHEENKRMKR
ncbi:hypothetical protein GJ496_001440 [Pomphorhynchus laevis]|nr:hypothetical protein GJ496_001440 [Pomphorhynchus laevis]